jgi:putative NADPH-quinone reductase
VLIQVIHCHPLRNSYNHALFRAVVETLEQNGHRVIATDLYREGFQPVMTVEERRTYMDNGYDGHDVAGYIDTLKKVDGIVFCFPHWWFAMPAMLKGYVDRVWAPGVAFVYDPKDGHLAPNLGHIKLFGVITSYGSPQWIVRIFAGDAGRTVMMRGLKPMCARDAESFYLAHYGMDKSTPKTRQAFLDKVQARVAKI